MPALATSGLDRQSLDLPDGEIRRALHDLADVFQLSLVLPETLQGRTSFHLHEVTWPEAFKAVLDPAGYAFVEDDEHAEIVRARFDDYRFQFMLTGEDLGVLQTRGREHVQQVLAHLRAASMEADLL